MEFTFEKQDYLYLLAIIPIVILLIMFALGRRKMLMKKYGDLQVIAPLMPEISYSRPIIKSILIIFVLILITIAIAGPQYASKLVERETSTKGVELVIALDVSNSMSASDIKPTRLENAKLAISQLLKRLKNDKLGLIIFAGEAYTQVPITDDYAAIKMFLSNINTEAVPVQGTAIGAAIELGMKSFNPTSETGKALIVVTDGENHEDDALGAAKTAYENGVVVHTLGMGRPEGVPIPVAGRRGVFRTDKEGNKIVSRLNETMLRQVASAGGGIYVRANNTSTGLNTLFDEINSMDKGEITTSKYADYEPLFMYFAGFAIFFLLIEFSILDRKNRLLKNLNLWEHKI